MKSSFGRTTKNFFIKEDRVLCQVTPEEMSAMWETSIGGKIENNPLPVGKGRNLPTRKGQSLPLTRGAGGKNEIGKSLNGQSLSVQHFPVLEILSHLKPLDQMP